MSEKIIIGYFGDGVWAHNAFKKIVNDAKFKIAFVVLRYDSSDEVLATLPKEQNIPILKEKNINNPEFLDRLKDYNCDIFVSMSFDQIFKSEIINIPPLKTINCHAGKLPFYRGRNILNWALINDEKDFGITVHYMDTGIDTGDIILQKTYPISDNDNYASLLETAHIECASVLYEALCEIYSGTAKRTKQEGSGFYCSKREKGDEIIDWNSTSREIFNFVRAISPPAVGAKSYINGKEIQINKAVMIENAPIYKCKIGAVVGLGADYFVVKTKNSTIKITDFIYNGKIKSGDILLKGGGIVFKILILNDIFSKSNRTRCCGGR